MAFNFFGVYFEDVNNNEFRCGFYDNNKYQPIIEKKNKNTGNWEEVTKKNGTKAANKTCRDIRQELPINIPFPLNHTQNERVELINQLVYNLQRRVNENVNYRGAHS